jgi:transcriptional regulator with XRE-family HTH domain
MLQNHNISIDFSNIRGRILVHRNGGIIMNELLGSRIKALRSANNFTQEQVADQIGISRQKYARIESGVNSITLDILSKVAEVLGVTVGDITRVLDETPVVQYRAGEDNESSKKIFDMLDLFYANKHMCAKLQHKDVF